MRLCTAMESFLPGSSGGTCPKAGGGNALSQTDLAEIEESTERV